MPSNFLVEKLTLFLVLKGYAVAFDPLDGSSVISANFTVGSIFGVWPGGSLDGRRGDEQGF